MNFFLNLGFFHSLPLYGNYSFQASERTLLLQYFAQLEQHRINRKSYETNKHGRSLSFFFTECLIRVLFLDVRTKVTQKMEELCTEFPF